MTRNNLSLAAALFALVMLSSTGALAEAVLTQMSGDVQIGRGEPAVWTAARTGDSVAANARVRTGADGRVEIKMDAGTVRVHENSMLRLPPAVGDADQVELEEGRSLFDVLRRKGRRFEVHTPTVVVSVKGTRFGVDAGIDIGEVTVYRGTVGVREVGAADMMETLVREGFLATGGVGMPIELDVSVAADPWSAWQEVSGAMAPRREAPTRLGEMDRARAALHRATTASVIRKAAERRPEIAKRLSELQERQRAKAAEEGDREEPGQRPHTRPERGSDDPRPMPASPNFGAERAQGIDPALATDSVRDGMLKIRRLEVREKVRENNPLLDGDRSLLDFEETASSQEQGNAAVFTANGIPLDYKALYDLAPAALILVRSASTEINGDFQNGTFVPSAPTDLLVELRDQLVSMGLSPLQASITVQVATGSTVP